MQGFNQANATACNTTFPITKKFPTEKNIFLNIHFYCFKQYVSLSYSVEF